MEELRKSGGVLTKDATITDEEMRDIENGKRELKRLRDVMKEKKPDTFYLPIEEERKKELIDIITKKRRFFTEAEMQKRSFEELDDQYSEVY